MRAEIARELLLVLARARSPRCGSPSGGELHAEMAEAADALHGHEIAGARARVAKRVEGGDAGAEERRGLAASRSSGIDASASIGAIM